MGQIAGALPAVGDAEEGVVRRTGELTLSTTPTLYGCCGLWDRCGDGDLLSLSLEKSGKLLDYIGWSPSLECVIRKEFITWIRPEQHLVLVNTGPEQHYEQRCTEGYVADPCDEAEGAEWGGCDFELRDFARFRRRGPVRDITTNRLMYCKQQPKVHIDGTLVSDDREADLIAAAEVMTQDLKRHIIIGNAATPGQFSGLNTLVRTGYTGTDGHRCTSMDSIIVNWNSNTMAGGAGMTWNGAPIAATFDFVDVLLAVFRHIKQNIGYAPVLANQNPRVGDTVLVMPTFMTRCLLDMYTCWSVCANSVIETYESRKFREQLNGGMFGDGRIFLDGFEIPLLAHDWALTQGPTRADIYLLNRSVGNVRLMEGQYLDMKSVPGDAPGGAFDVTDGGRILTWTNYDQTCYQRYLEMRPRLLLWAPWAQARFEDVVCAGVHGPKSPDPCESSYFPEQSFIQRSCE
jgi:hypothetical protein